MAAQSFGFGPISKLAAISRLLAEHERLFLGSGSSLQFAQANKTAFDQVCDSEKVDQYHWTELVAGADLLISVMSPEAVFQAVASRRPVIFIDSLFAFWRLERGLAHVVRHLRPDKTSILDVCAKLTVHEAMVAAHLLADVSLVQHGPGADERVMELSAAARGDLLLTGPIIDTQAIRNTANSRRPAKSSSTSLLINIGGFKNPFVDYEIKNSYLRLLSRWCGDLPVDWPMFDQIVVCGGAYDGSFEANPSDRLQYALLSQSDFLRAVCESSYYFMTPGLTSLNEAVALKVLPFALPEQHYGHVHNIRALKGTLFAGLASTLGDCVDGYSVPDSDEEGTAAILSAIESILSDQSLYGRFRRTMNSRIDRFLQTPDAVRSAAVDELRSVFDGPDVTEVVSRYVNVGRQG